VVRWAALAVGITMGALGALPVEAKEAWVDPPPGAEARPPASAASSRSELSSPNAGMPQGWPDEASRRAAISTAAAGEPPTARDEVPAAGGPATAHHEFPAAGGTATAQHEVVPQGRWGAAIPPVVPNGRDAALPERRTVSQRTLRRLGPLAGFAAASPGAASSHALPQDAAQSAVADDPRPHLRPSPSQAVRVMRLKRGRMIVVFTRLSR